MTASNLFLKIEKTILANIIVSCIISISLGVFEMPFIHFFIYSSIISFFILSLLYAIKIKNGYSILCLGFTSYIAGNSLQMIKAYPSNLIKIGIGIELIALLVLIIRSVNDKKVMNNQLWIKILSPIIIGLTIGIPLLSGIELKELKFLDYLAIGLCLTVRFREDTDELLNAGEKRIYNLFAIQLGLTITSNLINTFTLLN